MPAVTFSVALLAGLFAATAGDLGPSLPLGLGALGGGTLLVIAARSVTRPAPARSAVVAALLGALSGAALAPAPRTPELDALEREAARFSGVVVADDGDRGIVETERHRVAVRGLDLPPGTLVAIEGAVGVTPRFRNPSPHPEWPMLGAADLRITELRRVEVVDEASLAAQLVHSLRGRARAALVRTLDAETAGIARALVLGDARAVPTSAAEAVRGAGLTHVLAVSGMHVTLVVGSLALALRWALVRVTWRIRRLDASRLASGLAAPLALVYAELAGGSASAWRAAITAALGYALTAAGRRPRPWALVAACAVPFAAIDPAAATSPAFFLSLAATAAVLDPTPHDAPLASVVRTSMRAAIATAPVVIWCFGAAPLVGIAANVVVVPVACTLLLPLSLAHTGLAALDVPGTSLSAVALETGTRAFVAASEGFGRLSFAHTLPPPDLVEGLVLAAMALALLWLAHPRAKMLALAACLVAGGAAELSLRAREHPVGSLRVTFLDVGQGDAAVLDLPGGEVVVIDMGGAPDGGADPGERALVPLLRARRATHVDLAIVTHPHPDHYGGLPALADALPVRELWDTGQARGESPGGSLDTLLLGLAARGTRIRRPGSVCGPARPLGGVWLDVLAPCPDWDPGWDPNDNSFVVRVRHGRRTFLFAGDAEAHTEHTLAGRVGHVDVLKVGHHGSRTSSAEAWLDELSPWLAVVSAGRLNRFGHPHAEVATRLRAHARHLVRTDLDGGVVVRSDGRSLRFETWSGRRGALVND